MPGIIVRSKRGLHHPDAGLHAWGPGEFFDFPDDPAYEGWLKGQIERGACVLADKPQESAKLREEAKDSALAKDLADADKTQHPEGADGKPVTAEETPAVYAESALGPTSGSTPQVSGPGAVDVDLSQPREEPEQVHADGAEGLTIGSTSGPAPASVDIEKDLADANVTQHPEQLAALRGKHGVKPGRRH